MLMLLFYFAQFVNRTYRTKLIVFVIASHFYIIYLNEKFKSQSIINIYFLPLLLCAFVNAQTIYAKMNSVDITNT